MVSGRTRVAPQWFDIRPGSDGLVHVVEPYASPLIRSNIWLVRGRDRDLLVDSGLGVASLRHALDGFLERPVVAVATHTHYDHVGSLHEFDERLVHPSEAADLEHPPERAVLRRSDIPAAGLRMLEDAGYPIDREDFLSAHPSADFDPAAFATTPTTATGLLDEGDVVDLGDRFFELLHLPGHSPGGIALLERTTGTLYAGDVIYDGPLLDNLRGSDREAYVLSMERLRRLDVTVVHAGHDASFGRERLVEIADAYIAKCTESRSAEDHHGRVR